ncbi:HNH endonuclease [Streptomyces spororaveus]|uniref:HNH endonuclease n=1 Tax=Streptomyces spororaveus TaxID=284039 RepID=UPI0037BDC130
MPPLKSEGSADGTDTDGNVQLLCRPCHRLKTRARTLGAAGAPFRGCRATSVQRR